MELELEAEGFGDGLVGDIIVAGIVLAGMLISPGCLHDALGVAYSPA